MEELVNALFDEGVLDPAVVVVAALGRKPGDYWGIELTSLAVVSSALGAAHR